MIIDFKTFILQLVHIALASPSYLVLKNQIVMIILTRSLTLHMALETVLLSVVVLYCKSVVQAKGGKIFLI